MTGEIIFSNRLATLLGIDEDHVFVLARARRLPFAISSEQPRLLFVSAAELPIWREAVTEAAP
jgi:hypothetical protein